MTTGPATVRDLLEARAMEHGERTFAILPDATLSYRDLDDLADRIALVLLDLGFGAGDIVMVRAPNGWATMAAWFGCNKLGAVYLPLNALLTGEPLRQVMAHSRGRIVIVDHTLVEDVEAVREGLPDLTTVIVAGGPQGKHLRLEDLLDRSAGGLVPALVDDVAAPTK
ncbi:MAG: AMP-binding protein, partial [Actinomycetota bacterium]|nr:AMP-binding protein [Actinomycetota bacterium]